MRSLIVLAAFIFVSSFGPGNALAADSDSVQARLAPTGADFTVEKLDQGLSRLFVAVEKSRSRAEKLALLENFHQTLRRELHQRANTSERDAAFWRAVDIDVTVTNLIDTNCSDLKQSLMFAQHNMIDNDQTAISADTEKALELADAVCTR
jgi:hypothetical protein